jgi:hypothetical protein
MSMSVGELHGPRTSASTATRESRTAASLPEHDVDALATQKLFEHMSPDGHACDALHVTSQSPKLGE